ncbi:hypothetical protein W02_31930 [Nitrospira sp. KM1]|nr:hypothetical protein W02_31930 [Nitrospira sp. KM1]
MFIAGMKEILPAMVPNALTAMGSRAWQGRLRERAGGTAMSLKRWHSFATIGLAADDRGSDYVVETRDRWD